MKVPMVELRRSAHRVKDTSRSVLPLLSMSATNGVRLRDESDGRAASEDRSSYLAVKAGDIVVNKLSARDGAFGRSSLEGIVSPAYWVLSAAPEFDSRYLDYFLHSSPAMSEIGRLSKFMPPAQYDIAWDDFARMLVPKPPLEEQRRIADFLDDQVTRIQRTCDLRSQQMEAIRLAFNARVAHDLIESSGGCAAPLRRFLAGVRTGSTPPEDWVAEESGVPWYTPASISPAGSLGLPVRLLPDGATRRDGVVHFKPRSVLLVGIGATAGRVALLDHPGAGNQQLTALEVNDRLDWIFLYFQLKVRSEQLLESAPFTTLPIINNDTIRTFSIVAPPMRDQLTLVGDWLSAESRAESTLMQMRQVVARLNEYKSSLITAAVTGEMDVTTARRGVPA